jgi:hypothetical protein
VAGSTPLGFPWATLSPSMVTSKSPSGPMSWPARAVRAAAVAAETEALEPSPADGGMSLSTVSLAGGTS